MVSINPTPATCVAAIGQDANFETRFNAMENAIFKLGSTLEKFISTNNPTGTSRGENDRGYLTDLSTVTVAHLLKRNPTEMLWMLTSAEYQMMYLIKTLICWFQMLQNRINQVR